MALSVMINLDDMLFAAYNLGAEISENTPRLSKEELRAKLLSGVPLIAGTKPTKAAKKTKAPKTSDDETASETETAAEKPAKAPKAEKKPKEAKQKAEKKPKAEPEGDIRCSARSLYEKEHIEGGKPKVMRDDEANQFGDRCKFKKVGETSFCKHHAEKQPHGVWGGEYSGKLKTLIEKANAPAEEPKPAKKVVKKAAKATAEESAAEEPKPAKKVVKKAAKSAAEEPKTPPKPTKAVKPNAPKRPTKEEDDEEEDDLDEDPEDEYYEADVLENANIEYTWIEIDGCDYMIDDAGVTYDPETEEKIGMYDVKAKKWTSGGPASE